MDKIGLTDPALVFHSFRHGFRDACRMAGLSEEVTNALGGWAATSVGQKYGDRGMLPLLDRKDRVSAALRAPRAAEEGSAVTRLVRDQVIEGAKRGT